MKNRYGSIIIVTLALVITSIFGFLLNANFVNALEEFDQDGYILVANINNDSDAINKQCYFESGTSYKKTYDGNIVFNDINDNKVSIDSKNFIHYSNSSMASLDDTVLLDTDKIEDTQISYYALSSKSILNKAGDSYTTINAGSGNLNFSNFVWKISDKRYMVVSSTVTLVVSETSQQNFNDYIELEYIDEGVAHLVNQDGTYSTISSEAYLQLGNGVRIYIGSKNVSDGESILVNLTQMVVDSDDNIEVIPDEDYTIENDEQPQIVVNATDGANGEAGSAGEEGNPGTEGQKGTQGKAGNPGTQGSLGDDGDSAENSELEYIQETLPIFSLNNNGFEVTAYSVNAAINFNSNGCTMPSETEGHAVTYLIIDNSDGNIVWKRDLYINEMNDGGVNYLTGDQEEAVKTLKQDTNYTLAINATFLPQSTDARGSSPDYITQQVFQQQFTTDTYALNLEYEHSTTESLRYDLHVGTEAIGTITSFEVRLYDEDKNLVSETLPGQSYTVSVTDELRMDATTKVISIDDLVEGVDAKVEFTNLERNKKYFARIIVTTAQDVAATVPTSDFEYVEGWTKKELPYVEVPTVSWNQRQNCFTITPGKVEDVDNGVTGYRFDFYKVVTNGVETEYKLVYQYNTKVLDEFTMPIATSSEVSADNVLLTLTDYVVQQVALFNDNISDVEVGSVYSDRFATNADVRWPSATIYLNTIDNPASQYDGCSSPSIIDGQVTIRDDNHVISEGSDIIVEYKSIGNVGHYSNGTWDESSAITDRYVISNHDALATTYDAGLYQFEFTFNALKDDTRYTVSVYAAEVKWRETSTSNLVTRKNELLTNISTKTSKYQDLFVSGFDLSSELNPDLESDAGASFKVNVFFTLDPDTYQKEIDSMIEFTDNCYEKYGIRNSLDLSAKALTEVSFDVYSAKKVVVNDVATLVPFEKLNTTEGSLSFTNEDYEGTVDNPTSNLSYAKLYNFTTYPDFYRKKFNTNKVKGAYVDKDHYSANLTKDTIGIDQYKITFTSNNFNEETQQAIGNYKIEFFNTYGESAKVFIKVNNGYDYTYGADESSTVRLYSSSNKINIGDSENTIWLYKDANNGVYYTGDIYDQWVDTAVANTKPAWKEAPYYDSIETIRYDSANASIMYNTLNNGVSVVKSFDVGDNLLSQLDITNLESSNKTVSGLKTLWDSTITSTQSTVGYRIVPDSTWLGSYACAVRYTLYKNIYREGQLVDQIEITKSYNSIPNGYYRMSNTDILEEEIITASKFSDDIADGWMYFTSTYQKNNGMPSWIFFLDTVSDKTGYGYYDDQSVFHNYSEDLNRGDVFSIKTEIRLRDFTDNPIWPEKAGQVIEESRVIYKQAPIIRMFQYIGDSNSSAYAEYISYIKDNDHTLKYNNDNNLLVSDSDDSEHNDIISILTQIPGKNDFYYISVPINNVEGNLEAYYDVGQSMTLKNNGKLITIKNGYNSNKHTLVSKNDSFSSSNLILKNMTVEEGANAYNIKINLYSSAASLDSINKLDIVFNNKIDPANNTVTIPIAQSKYINIRSTSNGPLDLNEDGDFDDPGEDLIYHSFTIPLSISYYEISDIVDSASGESNYLDCTANIYSATGKYGVNFVTNNSSTKLYMLQNIGTGEDIDGIFNTVDGFEYDASSVTYDNNSYTYSSSGLTYIPQQVIKISLVETNIELKYIPPNGFIECINKGRSFIGISTTISRTGTITVDSNHGIELYYRVHQSSGEVSAKNVDPVEVVSSGNWTKKIVSSTTANLTGIKTNVEDLDYNTLYDFVLIGYYKTKSGGVPVYNPVLINYLENSEIIDADDKVRTLSKLTTDITKSELSLSYTAENRITKKLNLTLAFKDVNVIDFKKGVAGLKISIYQEVAGSDDIKIFDVDKDGENYVINGQTIYNYIHSKNAGIDDYTTLNVNYVHSFDFVPLTNAEHRIDSNTKYYAIAELVYDVPSTASDLDRYQQISGISKKFDPWYKLLNGVDSNNYFKIYPSNGVDTVEKPGGGNEYHYSVTFKINGSDFKRILTSNVDNTNGDNYKKKIAYLCELHKVDLDGNDLIVDINYDTKNGTRTDITTPALVTTKIEESGVISSTAEDVVRKVLFVEVSTSWQNISAYTIKCCDLELATRYYLKLYAVVDYNNLDLLAPTIDSLKADKNVGGSIINIVDLTNTGGKTRYNYSDESETISTPSTTGIEVTAVNLNPEATDESKVSIVGNGLNLVEKIQYTLTYYDGQDYTEMPEVTLTNDINDVDVTNNIYALGSYWIKSTGSSNVYYLNVPELNNKNYEYEIVIKLYNSTASTAKVAVQPIGNYTPKANNTTSKVSAPSPFMNMLNSFIDDTIDTLNN